MAGSVVRLKDIAAHTGFSVNTVSLALRDSERIPDETRQRIREAAEELDYLPNFVAKSLVNRETKTIGLVLTDVTNPVLTRVAQAVERLLAERGYGTLLGASNGDGGEEMPRARDVPLATGRWHARLPAQPPGARRGAPAARRRAAGGAARRRSRLRPRRGRDRRAPRRGQGGPAPDRARAPADRHARQLWAARQRREARRAMSRRSPRPASRSTRPSSSTRAAARSATAASPAPGCWRCPSGRRRSSPTTIRSRSGRCAPASSPAWRFPTTSRSSASTISSSASTPRRRCRASTTRCGQSRSAPSSGCSS